MGIIESTFTISRVELNPTNQLDEREKDSTSKLPYRGYSLRHEICQILVRHFLPKV